MIDDANRLNQLKTQCFFNRDNRAKFDPAGARKKSSNPQNCPIPAPSKGETAFSRSEISDTHLKQRTGKMSKARWMKNTVEEAATCTTKMPWERGLRRQAMITRRLETETRSVKISLAPLPEGLCLAG
ncbi:hypothetical protein [Loktanella sp. SALINAS62]|uniref:hypothetical protein n=1 Tax=Loktanella sp. SALINAS62 TaxID=2706124 RepID=UPI001B8D32CF|nr:hypothetical protein [Loktanella sp. SALINAS62]MBS1301273.1 hypothetical protein [Loktanella sp. SALINAS62]